MNRQYALVDECLKLLREKNINPNQKLRIDLQLIQLKALVLVRDMDEAEADSFMVTLLAVCRNISEVDGGASASAAFDEVRIGLQRIINDLAKGAGLKRGGE